MFLPQTYTSRRALLRHRVLRGGLILLPGNGEASMNYPDNTYRFRQDSTFLYYFGLNLPALAGLIDADTGEEWLFGDDLTMDDIIWTGPQPTIAELGEKAGISLTGPLSLLHEKLALAVKSNRRIHYLPPYRAETANAISSLLGVKRSAVADRASVELALAVVSQRDIKSDEEVERIEVSLEIAYKMHVTAMRMCREGVVEREIAGALEGISLQYGGGVSFPPIVTINGQTLHNHFYGNTLQRGKLLLIDAGAECTMGYASDLTRTIPVGGRFSQQQKDIYNLVLKANDRAFELSRPDVNYKEVHLAAVTTLAQGLIEMGLMRGDAEAAVEAGAMALFMPHGLGHMMGLDVHDMENIGEKYVGYDLEVERSKQLGVGSLRMGRRLKPGMVLTVEPGIYFIPAYIDKWREENRCAEFIDYGALDAYRDFGGIRIEDDMLITREGNRLLGARRAPVTVEEIESLVKN